MEASCMPPCLISGPYSQFPWLWPSNLHPTALAAILYRFVTQSYYSSAVESFVHVTSLCKALYSVTEPCCSVLGYTRVLAWCMGEWKVLPVPLITLLWCITCLEYGMGKMFLGCISLILDNYITLHIFNVQRYVGWGCILNCFISSLPYFYPFYWSAIPTSRYIFNIFYLVIDSVYSWGP